MNTRSICGASLIAVCLACLAGGCADALEPSYAKPGAQEEAASSRSQVIGKPAPDFTLSDQDGKSVTLSALRGQWVVLYFYPADDTPGCTCEATEFTTLLGQFGKAKAKVYGISSDSSRSHQAFIGQYKIGIDLLSDPDHKVMTDYGAWVTASLGPMKYQRLIRSTFIIGPDGVIRHHWPEVIPKGHAQRVHDRLVMLQKQTK